MKNVYDFVLRNCTIMDGTGGPAYSGDICVQDGKIARICDCYDGECEKQIDCAGLITAPGFIDMHSHSDVCPFGENFPDSKILQGITTELCGNCGVGSIGMADKDHKLLAKSIWELYEQEPGKNGDGCYNTLSEYKEAVEKLGYPSNIAMLAGHGPVRERVLGNENRAPDAAELLKMQEELESLLKEGAFGLSYGLIYPPGSFSKSDELIALAEVCAKNDAFVAVHMRSEGLEILEAFDEMVDVARASGARLEISHLKILTKKLWGKSVELIDKMDKARAEGIDIHCDQYPFTASNTVAAALLPREALAGSKAKLLFKLFFPSKETLAAVDRTIDERGGPESVLISQTGGRYPDYEGKTLQEISDEYGIEPAKLVVKMVRTVFTAAKAFFFCISRDDMLNFMRQPYVCVGSDGSAYSFDHIEDLMPHPRNLCTYPEYIRTIRETGVLSLEEAVRRMTGLPAEIMGLGDRGLLREGMAADITVFNFDTARGIDLYKKSPGKPEGIEYVIVNGETVVDRGRVTGAKPGKVLLKNTAQA